ncbi:hypothetical protein Patl1_34927 [Pistacia atlantica]|uniref:Uncharacterized protein n=1 Tax=Pistacia atlantica TaxID=434234 RepID=A0ACC0ZQM2_9ROSI|nr:hypothetical protein Patl1_34927 [Pistacia atlantica]
MGIPWNEKPAETSLGDGAFGGCSRGQDYKLFQFAASFQCSDQS